MSGPWSHASLSPSAVSFGPRYRGVTEDGEAVAIKAMGQPDGCGSKRLGTQKDHIGKKEK